MFNILSLHTRTPPLVWLNCRHDPHLTILCRLASVLLLAFAAPAAAQNGAMWVDNRGRIMSMHFAGGDGAPPDRLDRAPADMASLFTRLCIESGGNPATRSVDLQSEGLMPVPFTIDATKNAPAITLNSWRGQGVVVSQTSGFFAAPNAQCNAIFYVQTLPDRQGLAAALATALGAPPSNASEATKKNGEPNKGFSPRWDINRAGTPAIVSIQFLGGSRYMPGDLVQISIRDPKKAK